MTEVPWISWKRVEFGVCASDWILISLCAGEAAFLHPSHNITNLKSETQVNMSDHHWRLQIDQWESCAGRTLHRESSTLSVWLTSHQAEEQVTMMTTTPAHITSQWSAVCSAADPQTHTLTHFNIIDQSYFNNLNKFICVNMNLQMIHHSDQISNQWAFLFDVFITWTVKNFSCIWGTWDWLSFLLEQFHVYWGGHQHLLSLGLMVLADVRHSGLFDFSVFFTSES